LLEHRALDVYAQEDSECRVQTILIYLKPKHLTPMLESIPR